MTFDVPLLTAQPATSITPIPNPVSTPQTRALTQFTLHNVPEDQTGAGKEAMIQAGLMMQRLKEVYESSKLAYDASTSLQANVRVSAIVS